MHTVISSRGNYTATFMDQFSVSLNFINWSLVNATDTSYMLVEAE